MCSESYAIGLGAEELSSFFLLALGSGSFHSLSKSVPCVHTPIADLPAKSKLILIINLVLAQTK